MGPGQGAGGGGAAAAGEDSADSGPGPARHARVIAQLDSSSQDNSEVHFAQVHNMEPMALLGSEGGQCS